MIVGSPNAINKKENKNKQMSIKLIFSTGYEFRTPATETDYYNHYAIATRVIAMNQIP